MQWQAGKRGYCVLGLALFSEVQISISVQCWSPITILLVEVEVQEAVLLLLNFVVRTWWFALKRDSASESCSRTSS